MVLEIITIDFDDIWQKYSKDSHRIKYVGLFLSTFHLSNWTIKIT